MEVNSSSFGSYLDFFNCYNIYYNVQSVQVILILPLSTFVLYLGLQRWRQQHSRTWSHTDVFTYHVCVMELLWVCGSLLQSTARYCPCTLLMSYGQWMCDFASYGEVLFQMLTCVERHIAVVHPVSYLRLRSTCGVRIRNVSAGCVWLISAGLTSLPFIIDITNITLSLLVFSTIATSCCSLSVLCVLIRPGPGEGGGDKERVDQSKQRAFNTITAILGVQLFWLLGLLISTVVFQLRLLSLDVSCVVLLSVSFSDLPSSLLLPLLYLHRAGRPRWSCFNRQ